VPKYKSEFKYKCLVGSWGGLSAWLEVTRQHLSDRAHMTFSLTLMETVRLL